MHFDRQLEAIGTALLLIQKLPDWAVWALTCTNDDDADSPSVLNIFAPESHWQRLCETLKLGRPVDRSTGEKGSQFLSFRHGTLLISIIEQEETLT